MVRFDFEFNCECERQQVCFATYLNFMAFRWVLILIAVILFLIGTSTSAQIAYLVFGLIDLLLIVFFIVIYVKRSNIGMIVFMVILIIAVLLTVAELICSASAIAFKPTYVTQNDGYFLAGAIFGLCGAIFTIPTAIALLFSKGDTPLGDL